MNKPDIFGLEYKIGKKRYVLSKHEIRCIDAAKPQNNFSLPLNQIDPYYSVAGDYHSACIFFGLYAVFGVITKTYQWISGTPFDTFHTIQSIFMVVLALVVGSHLYRWINHRASYTFGFLLDNGIAFVLPTDKKHKEQAETFVASIVERIHKTVPSNEQVLFLLCQYGLLTQTESTQLESYIQENQQTTKSEKNVIYLAK